MNKISLRHSGNIHVAPAIWLFLQLARELVKVDKLSTVRNDIKRRCYRQKINPRIIL